MYHRTTHVDHPDPAIPIARAPRCPNKNAQSKTKFTTEAVTSETEISATPADRLQKPSQRHIRHQRRRRPHQRPHISPRLGRNISGGSKVRQQAKHSHSCKHDQRRRHNNNPERLRQQKDTLLLLTPPKCLRNKRFQPIQQINCAENERIKNRISQGRSRNRQSRIVQPSNHQRIDNIRRHPAQLAQSQRRSQAARKAKLRPEVRRLGRAYRNELGSTLQISSQSNHKLFILGTFVDSIPRSPGRVARLRLHSEITPDFTSATNPIARKRETSRVIHGTRVLFPSQQKPAFTRCFQSLWCRSL